MEISADTPEASIASIKAIAHAEAKKAGAEISVSETNDGRHYDTTIALAREKRNLRISLGWVHSQQMSPASTPLGNGLINGYEAELLVGDPPSWTEKNQAPFRWGLFLWGKKKVNAPPELLLTGDELRRIIRDSLQPN
jgi:hypothetical protein